MNTIQTITFSRDRPKKYDEKWDADLAGTGKITGYRTGTDVYIVGRHIYANPRSSYMFAARNGYDLPLWSSLTEINGLELIDTSKVETMRSMFDRSLCGELNGLERWDTSSVTDMSAMFYGCTSLLYIYVDDWDVSNVTTFSHMFADCHSLQIVNFSKWETLSVDSFDALLNDCRSIASIDVSGLDTGSCRQFSQMFEGCENLEYIYGLESWDVSNASHYAFTETFHRCYMLREINIGNWKAPRVDSTARMFKDCRSLEYIDISGLRGSGDVVDTEMFYGCERLKEIVRAY